MPSSRCTDWSISCTSGRWRRRSSAGWPGSWSGGSSPATKTYGYRTVGVPSGKTDVNGQPELLGKRRVIQEAEADIVRQMFEWTARGIGVFTIIRRLQERVPGPWGKPWTQGTIRRILRNEVYLGKLIWGRVSYERQPGTNKMVRRAQPRSAVEGHGGARPADRQRQPVAAGARPGDGDSSPPQGRQSGARPPPRPPVETPVLRLPDAGLRGLHRGRQLRQGRRPALRVPPRVSPIHLRQPDRDEGRTKVETAAARTAPGRTPAPRHHGLHRPGDRRRSEDAPTLEHKRRC